MKGLVCFYNSIRVDSWGSITKFIVNVTQVGFYHFLVIFTSFKWLMADAISGTVMVGGQYLRRTRSVCCERPFYPEPSQGSNKRFSKTRLSRVNRKKRQGKNILAYFKNHLQSLSGAWVIELPILSLCPFLFTIFFSITFLEAKIDKILMTTSRCSAASSPPVQQLHLLGLSSPVDTFRVNNTIDCLWSCIC